MSPAPKKYISTTNHDWRTKRTLWTPVILYIHFNYQSRRTHQSLFAHPILYTLFRYQSPRAHPLWTPLHQFIQTHTLDTHFPVHTFQLPIATDATITLHTPIYQSWWAHTLGTPPSPIHATTAFNTQLWYVSGFRTLSICLGCRVAWWHPDKIP